MDSRQQQAAAGAGTGGSVPRGRGPSAPKGHRRQYRSQKIAHAVLALFALVSVGPVVAIIAYLFYKGGSAMSWEFLTAMPSKGMKAGGIFPAIVGTFWLILGTVIFAVPVGTLAAIYLTEYARQGRLTRIIRLAIANMAGVPSIVYGLFGLGLFVLLMGLGTSILSGSLTLGILVLPVVITAAEEALTAVPQSFRQASLALGATRWQTIRKVVLPNSISGIITGTVLAVGRAAGETAAIMFTVAAFFLPALPDSPFSQAMALPYHLYTVSTQVPGMPEEMKWGTALVLLLLVLSFTLSAALVRLRFRRKKRW
ncbi:MAG: phosphate ABC transporter permease PstA [Gaiellales bacterium]|nr:MAG: phosphate ABC transporter permease PstA [Gaiellales bacterium]